MWLILYNMALRVKQSVKTILNLGYRVKRNFIKD